MISKTTLSIAAGICGTIFLGYCIYFDRRRRNDPDFKKKLREREFTPPTFLLTDKFQRIICVFVKNAHRKVPILSD
jgi:MAS20 protein import receptor